jgi:GT2 family glycosyltransferase
MYKASKDKPIWIVFVNYHSQKLVCRCLETLKKHIFLPYEVVVVDNSIKPDTVEISEAFKDVEIITPTGNDGFAAGCNMGVRKAIENRADFILLLNPVTFTEQDFISPMYDDFNDNAKLGIAGPSIYYENPSK